MLKIVTTASNELEASLVVGRLTEAGIHCICSGGSFGQVGVVYGIVAGGRSVYVEERDFARAREVLKADEGDFDEEELARLSEEAGKEAAGSGPSSAASTPPSTDSEVEPPARAPAAAPAAEKKHGLLERVESLTKGRRATDADNPFGH
jgi:Putative prokaryotic signal transducing protein